VLLVTLLFNPSKTADEKEWNVAFVFGTDVGQRRTKHRFYSVSHTHTHTHTHRYSYMMMMMT